MFIKLTVLNEDIQKVALKHFCQANTHKTTKTVKVETVIYKQKINKTEKSVKTAK